jgi:Fis family transcriptional regulator
VKDQLETLVLQMHHSKILYSEAVREFKKRFILTVLEDNRGNQCRAARELGMHRNTLWPNLQSTSSLCVTGESGLRGAPGPWPRSASSLVSPSLRIRRVPRHNAGGTPRDRQITVRVKRKRDSSRELSLPYFSVLRASARALCDGPGQLS